MKKILVVDDNEMNREIITRKLKKSGYAVENAEDGKQGLECVKSQKPDLVLLDISLPEMDGYEVAKRCKEDPETKNIPIIALTAHAMKGDRDKALEAGCDEYETKPINFNDLFEKISKFVA